MSKYRGHHIMQWLSEDWRYADTGQLSYSDRPCGRCHLPRTPEGHDQCLGEIKGIMNACCGHGSVGEAYVQFSPEYRIAGEVALAFMRTLGRSQRFDIELAEQAFGFNAGELD